MSQLTYGLQTVWFTKASRSKLDAFHVRCLRRILGIAHSYWSRISNQEVLHRIGAPKLSMILLEQQLVFLGTLARRPDTCPVRNFVFDRQLRRAPIEFERRRGRPNLEWVSEMFKVLEQMFTSHDAFCACVLNKCEWRSTIRNHCRRQAA